MAEAAHRSAPARHVLEMRAVRITRMVGERWCLRWVATHSVTGPSIAIEPNTASSIRTPRVVLKLRWVKSR